MTDFAAPGLEAFQDAALAMLAQAAAGRSQALRTLTLGTLTLGDGASGLPSVGLPSVGLRSVVLRGVELAARRLSIHADQRSSKIHEIRRDPRASVLGYDPEARLQIRLEGVCALHHADAAAAREWERTGSASRQIYRVMPQSGTPAGAEADIDPQGLGEAEAFQNFTLISFTFHRAETLFLGQDRHRRARSVWDEAGRHSSWIVP